MENLSSRKLEGKVVIVTGGARDIGQQISIKLANEGASVCIYYFNSQEAAKETLKIIENKGGKAIIIKGDMTKKDDINNLVSKCHESFREHIHTLVNVTGGLVARKRIKEMDLDFWNYVIKLNLSSVFLVTKAVLPYMPKDSTIINFSSQAARDGGGMGATAYAASKGAVLSFTRGLAKELGPKKNTS